MKSKTIFSALFALLTVSTQAETLEQRICRGSYGIPAPEGIAAIVGSDESGKTIFRQVYAHENGRPVYSAVYVLLDEKMTLCEAIRYDGTILYQRDDFADRVDMEDLTQNMVKKYHAIPGNATIEQRGNVVRVDIHRNWNKKIKCITPKF